MKVKLIVILLSSLFISCSDENVSKITLQEFENILIQSVHTSTEQYSTIEKEVMLNLREPQRKKYRFLGANIEKQKDGYYLFQTKLDSLLTRIKTSDFDFEKKVETLNQFQNILDRVDSTNLNLFKTEMTENYKIVGLRKNELEQRIKNSKSDLELLSKSIDPKVSDDISSDLIFLLKLKMFNFAVNERINFFGQLYMELVGGNSGCNWTIYLPMVFPKKTSIKQGEYFEAEIFVGTIHHAYYEETFGAIIVNNTDTLNIDKKTGKTLLKIKANKRGDYNLKLGARVSNDLTGEVSGGDIIYNYHVD